MRIKQSEQNEHIAVVKDMELLPALFSMEHVKARLVEHSGQGTGITPIEVYIADLEQKQLQFDEYCTQTIDGITPYHQESTESELDAAVLRLGLEGIFQGMRKGRERRLVKRMIRTLHKAGISEFHP